MIIQITLKLNKPHEANLVEWFCEGLIFTGAQGGNIPSSGPKTWLIFMVPWQSAEHQGPAPEAGAELLLHEISHILLCSMSWRPGSVRAGYTTTARVQTVWIWL